jgi:predicted double-glycine peptidase
VDLVSQGNLSEDNMKQAQAMLTKAQTELGDAVADTTTRVVTQKVDTSSGAAAGVASVLANSTVYVTDATVAANLGNKLEALKGSAAVPARRC